MKMTYEEYYFYSDIAKRIFDYMNGNINNMNSKCELYIDMYDLVYNTYANIRYPNHIHIHIGTIVDSWNDSFGLVMRKENYVVSCIAWALSHELHHADQLISMIQYNRAEAYKKKVEGDVERASYDWVANHANEISNIAGVRIVIRDIDSPTLPQSGNYTKAAVDQFYKQTIANIIIRDLDLYAKITALTDDSIADNIIVTFNDKDSLVIKSNGNYLIENINAFSALAYNYCGYYDIYSINVKAYENQPRSWIVAFSITNNLVRPMIFR